MRHEKNKNMKRRLIETAILMVYVIVLASSVSGEKDTVDETDGADTVAVVESKTIEEPELPAVTEETEMWEELTEIILRQSKRPEVLIFKDIFGDIEGEFYHTIEWTDIKIVMVMGEF